jgi:NAD(P)-dependent dehydrogenase (short-subunit alcohol dehydrogenase family)
MARIFITGSADGLGNLAARSLTEMGHEVVLHARNEDRSQTALDNVPKAEKVLVADLADSDAVRQLASKVNELGHFDAVIHNAAIYDPIGEEIFAVNSLAPYILTCLIDKPERLIYMSSGMHRSGKIDIANMAHSTTYSDSKLQILLLTKALARLWPDVYTNAVNPGWVPTKMGGSSAPDDLQKGYETQVWLAVSDDPGAKVSGKYFFHQKEAEYNPTVDDTSLQDKFLAGCEKLSGIKLPR